MPFSSQSDEKPTLDFQALDDDADFAGARARADHPPPPPKPPSGSLARAALTGASRLGVAAAVCVLLAVAIDVIYCLAIGQLDRVPSMLRTAASLIAAHLAIGAVGGAQARMCDLVDRRTGLPHPGIAGREGYRIAIVVGVVWFLAYRLSQIVFFRIFDWRELVAVLSLSIGVSLLGWMTLGFVGASLDRMGLGLLTAISKIKDRRAEQ